MASGFKNSTRMSSGFRFPSSAGYTTSTGKVQNISYSRKTPHRRAKFAEGGKIDSSLHSFKGDSQLNVEHGPSGGLRPGFTRGGYASKYADGGVVRRTVGAQSTAAERAKLQNQIMKETTGAQSTTAERRRMNTAEILRSGRKQQMSDLGLKKGGVPRFAKGGQIPPAKVAARQAVAKHVATPAPKGHKGLKGC